MLLQFQLSLKALSTLPGMLLMEPMPPKAATIAVHFAAAVWRVRGWLRDSPLRPNPSLAILQITAEAFQPSQTRQDKQTKLFRSTKARLTRIADKQQALSTINSLPARAVVVYTDGSALGGHGPAGAGVYAERPLKEFIFAALKNSTNNRAELTAIGIAVAWADRCVPQVSDLYIVTDSDYSIGVLTRGWATNKNSVLVEAVSDTVNSSRHRIHFVWAPGHTGILGNEIADRLADKGTQRSSEGEGIPPCKRTGDFFAHLHTLTPTDSQTLCNEARKGS
jgi:ribonuclease HI